jgi:hypothetical protein
MGWGAGGAASPLAAPQPRMGSGGEEVQNTGMAVMGRGVGGAASPLGAPQPSVGLEDKWDQRGARGNALEGKEGTRPLQPREIYPLTMAQTYAVATRLSLANNNEWQTQLSK